MTEVPVTVITPGGSLGSTFREKVVLIAGAVILGLTAVIIFLGLVLVGAKSAGTCDLSRANSASAVQQVRQTLGNEGRAAASALASSVIAANASPVTLRISLISAAEKIYSDTMITVNAGLAEHPVVSVEAC